MAKQMERQKKRWRKLCPKRNRNPSWLSISSSSPPRAVTSAQREEERLSTKLSQHGEESSLLTHVSGGGRGNSLPLCPSLCSPWPGSRSSSPLQQGALADTDLRDVQAWPLPSTLRASPALPTYLSPEVHLSMMKREITAGSRCRWSQTD